MNGSEKVADLEPTTELAKFVRTQSKKVSEDNMILLDIMARIEI